ncbi:DNA cytosine methyltransferase, partial [Escherichia coli]|nr:DNA cytosine methyltransferase [Escherichia coli]
MFAAKDFGVPQNRERIYIVGFMNDFLNQGRVKKVYVQAGTPFR